jgi:hypothetical protein
MSFEFPPRPTKYIDNVAETEKSNFWLTGYIEEENSLPLSQHTEFIGLVDSPPLRWTLKE